MKNLSEWNIYHPLLNHVAPTSGHVHNWAVNIFLPGLLIRIFMSSNDLSKYLYCLPTCYTLLHASSLSADMVTELSLLCFISVKTTHHSWFTIKSGSAALVKECWKNYMFCKLTQAQIRRRSNPKKSTAEELLATRSLAPPSMVMNDPVKRYGGILALPSPPRLPPFISLPCLFNTLNLFQHFSKLQIYIFCRTTWRKIHTKFYGERDNDDGDGTDDTS